jgi:hypothetical protein
MTRAIASVAIACALLVPVSAFAQQPTPTPTPSPNLTKPPNQSLWSRIWIVAGSGYAAARAGCPKCDPEGVVTKSYPVLLDFGVRMTPRVDAGFELYWVQLKVNDEPPIQTTFIMGLVQLRPWVDKGLFLRAGMGIGIVGNGLFNPNGPALAPPYTTNALALNFGVGWEFKVSRHFGFQVHGMQHVASLGELTTVSGERIFNVVGNYWTVGGAIVIR